MEGQPKKLGPYTLVSRIGLGGFGVVWLAEKRTAIATTQFALKLPRGEDIDLEAFKQEAAIWLQASGHPNVLPLIDADIYDDQVVIVSEYVPDGSLAGWLKRHGGKAPSAEAACEIMDGVLAGLNHLHTRRIIHRDLKPENILLQRETPRLADFGIARLLKSSSHSQKVSGTLAYMAPEAFDGHRNEQTDVWSVGVIFYEMLAGRLPYDQQDIPSFIGAIMRNDPPPLPDSVAEVLRQIVSKALQRDPANRYSSATEMRGDLREAEHQLWLGGREAIAKPPATTLPAFVPPVLQPTIPTIPVKTEPLILPVKPTLPGNTLPNDLISAPLPVAVKKKPRSLLWLAAISAVVLVLVLGIVSITGIYYWRSSRAAKQSPPAISGKQSSLPSNTTQAPTPEAARQARDQYALMQTLTGHTDRIYSVAFSPDGNTLASGSNDETVKLWDVRTGAVKQTLSGHKHFISSVAFSPDGKTLASASWDKTVKLWDVQTGALKQTLTRHTDAVYSVAFSPDGLMLASASEDKTIKLWDALTGILKESLTRDKYEVESVAFSPDGTTLASGTREGMIKLWDARTGALKQTLTGHSLSVAAIAFSPDGNVLASASYDNTAKVWDAQTGALKQTLSGHTSAVRSVAFSPDGTTLATGSEDRTIKLWDVRTASLKATLRGHDNSASSVRFSPDGKLLASGGEDRTIKLWRVE